MRYLPHTSEDIGEMLEVVGKKSLEDLFPTVPEALRFRGELDLPGPLTEWELSAHMNGLAGKMATAPDYKVFVGAGCYDHHIPSAVSYVIGRSEFATAYTPYQPEMAQGTLQGIFEYQTMAARLMGCEVANASMYDGATALAEALLMAIRSTKRKKVAVSKAIHPAYRAVVKTYFDPTEYEVVELGYLPDGRTDLSAIEGMGDLAAVAIQSPNFFGCIEELEKAAGIAHGVKALMVGCFTEAIAYGLLKNPGDSGADIVCGEGQSLGIASSFGGPGLGMFGCQKKFMRTLPGRVVGQTTDLDGKRGFVLTLSTREQHIRREKATSNICSNQGLCAMTAGAYMAAVGKEGIRALARVNRDKAEYLKAGLAGAGFTPVFSSPTFNEFVVKAPDGFAEKRETLIDGKKIIAGIPLECYYPELAGHYLFCATETVTKEDMDMLIREVRS
jgi:glycine dehydrogenase subunit 1